MTGQGSQGVQQNDAVRGYNFWGDILYLRRLGFQLQTTINTVPAAYCAEQSEHIGGPGFKSRHR